MTRVVRPKQAKKKKSHSFVDPFADLADFAPLQYLTQTNEGTSAQADEEFSKVLNKRVFDAMDEEAGKSKKRKAPIDYGNQQQQEGEEDGNEAHGDEHHNTNKSRKKRKVDQELQEPAEDDELYQQVLEQQNAKKSKRAQSRPTFSMPEQGEAEEEAGKRKVSDQIEKNKGLRKKTKKELKNPRVKHKLKYKKALVKRKSQVQAPLDKTKPYQGEITGIKSGVVKSTKL